MFATESPVRQLRPDKILSLVSGVEERQWRHIKLLDAAEEGCFTAADYSDPGLAILRHGTAVKKIHGYFSNLEFRRCCMLLAGRKFTFDSMRVVNLAGTGDHDQEPHPAERKEMAVMLDGKEFQCFRHAFLCASFPVLGAPSPPSPHTPSPTSSPHPSSPQGYSSGGLRPGGSPLWLDDSGVEVSDDVAMIPTETLCDLLQRAFRLNQDKYRHYQQAIAAKYRKKTPQKVLAEELVGQLTTLENNNHPFYNPHTFLNPQAYGLWQQSHRNTISRLFNKFWHSSLPLPCDLHGTLHDLETVHDDYVLLLNKLLLFENRFGAIDRQGSSAIIKPLSSASLRLLKEFSLRYGIGEVFVQVVYLEQLSRHFSPSPGLVTHTAAAVGALTKLLGGGGGAAGGLGREQVLVRKEQDILKAVLDSLLQLTTKALSQMKRLFPSNQPPQAIESLIELADLVQRLRSLLSLEPQEPLSSYLHHVVQRTFPPDYEHHKSVAKSELAERRDPGVSPKLLNALIGVIRDEVIDFKTNFQSTFKPYFDITTLAAQTYYSLLMADVEILCQGFSQSMSLDISLTMVGLAYRLHQLDHDWSSYIPPEAQVWRQSIQPQVVQWCLALKVHLQDFVLEAVAGEKFSTKSLHLENVSLSVSTSTLTQRTTPSLSPSATSAFSSIHTSVASPHVQTIPEEDSEESTYLVPGAWTLGTTSRPRPKTSFESRPQQKQDSCLTFSTLRHSNSLPDIASAVAEEKRIDEQMRAMGGGDGSDSGEMETAFGCPSESDSSSETSEEELGKEYQYPPVEVVPTLHAFTCSTEVEKEEASTSRPTSLFSRFLRSQPASSTASTSTSTSTSIHPIAIPAAPSRPHRPSPPARQLSLEDSSHQSSPERGSGRGWRGGGGTAASERPQVFSHDFEDSLGSVWSNLSLSVPQNRQDAELPVSGSLVDVLVLLRRLAAFASTLLDTVFPDSHGGGGSSSSVPNSPMSSGLSSAAFPAPHQAFPTHPGFPAPHPAFPPHPGFSGTSSSDGSHRDSFPSLHEIPPAQLKAKWDVVKRLRKCLHASLALYADNMLSLDLCGTPRLTASRLVGIKLVEHLMMQREGGLLWGCRHEMEGLGSCQRFSQPTAAMLCDRHEPISHKMCVRINNVVAAMELLEVFEGRLEAAAGRQRASSSSSFPSQSSRNSSTPSTTSLDEYSVIDEDESEEGWGSRRGGQGERGQPCPFTSSMGEELPPQEAQGPVHAHLLSVHRGQLRLMAFRLNLFVKDALSLLLRLTQSSAAIESILAPLTSFLSKYLDRLSSWLYRRAFHTFLECLWINIVQDFEVETERLREEGGHSERQAHRLLQSLMHLLRFMNNFGKGVTKTTMLAQAEGVIFRLQLYTLSVPQLLALHSKLCEYMYDVRRYWEPDSCLSHILLKLQQDLQARRKCFSGSDLVSWILRHKALFYDLDPVMAAEAEEEAQFTREVAVRVAQVLLDKRLLSNVEKETGWGWGRSHSGSLLSSPDPTYHYPELTHLPSQPMAQGLRPSRFEDSEETSDSDLTPMASPVPDEQPPDLGPPDPLPGVTLHTPTPQVGGGPRMEDASPPDLEEDRVESKSGGSVAPGASEPCHPEVKSEVTGSSQPAGSGGDQPAPTEAPSNFGLSSPSSRDGSCAPRQQQADPGFPFPDPAGRAAEGGEEDSLEASNEERELSHTSQSSPSSCHTPTNVIQSNEDVSQENCAPSSDTHLSEAAVEKGDDDDTRQVPCSREGSPQTPTLDQSSDAAPQLSGASASGVLPHPDAQPSFLPRKSMSADSSPTKFHSQRASASRSPAAFGHYTSFSSHPSASHTSTPTAFHRPQQRLSAPTPLSNFTPVSFLSVQSSFSGFVDTSDEFFYVLPAAVEMQSQSTTVPAGPGGEEHQPKPLFDLSEMRAEKLKKSPETLSMAIQCFRQKISPLHLLAIVYQRRQSSPEARRAVRRMPLALREQIKYHLNLPEAGCVNS